MNWIIDNLIAEIIFGLLFLPLAIWLIKLAYFYFIKAPRIIKILSIHNDPTRTWRKGIYAKDRFMQLYEVGVPLNSDEVLLYGGGDAGAVWWTEYLDKGILEKYKLITIFEEGGKKKAKINKNRLTDTIYKRIKRTEDKESKESEDFRKNIRKLRDYTPRS